MPADASAYEALGLEPGADDAAVERAYKRLIKKYHPDRAGGDPARAAEINRAYLELRGPRSSSRELVLHEEDDAPFRPSRAGWVAAALVLAVASLALVIVSALPAGRPSAAPPAAERRSAPVRPDDPMDQPLVEEAIEQGIRAAVRVAQSSDELALANASRECHRELRLRPGIAQLDRCAAFDAAVVQLQDRDPLRDRGPFGELLVTRRLMAGGALFSNDYLAIDGRIDRIRLRVELALAPRLPPPATNVTEKD